MKRTGSGDRRSTVGFRIDFPDDFIVQLDAAALLDAVSQEVVIHHRTAIRDGRKASGGPQNRLTPKGTQALMAGKGQRPTARGNRGALSKYPLHDHFIRSAIAETVRQTKSQKERGQYSIAAQATIGAGPMHSSFVERDGAGKISKAGATEYFFVDGDVSRVIDGAVERWLDGLFEGRSTKWESRELKAKAAKKSGSSGRS